MTSKWRLVVPFVCNCVVPVGVILTALREGMGVVIWLTLFL